LTRRDLLKDSPNTTVSELINRPPVVIYEDSSLREAIDQMTTEAVGRLPVVTRKDPDKVIGILTRSDLLAANKRRIEINQKTSRSLRLNIIRLSETVILFSYLCHPRENGDPALDFQQKIFWIPASRE